MGPITISELAHPLSASMGSTLKIALAHAYNAQTGQEWLAPKLRPCVKYGWSVPYRNKSLNYVLVVDICANKSITLDVDAILEF